MKKTIGKPENWQDFESLCKKLWGEIWEIPNKIKKNGRLGQEQAGVDVYGKPKGENQYWGIQAKGKDDYTNAKLTESEIAKEIEKAKTFEPNLAVFIIASSTNKDSKIEKFVRIKDIENQKNGSFEILLYCWEDIVDLIEENRETSNWYLGINNYRDKYDVQVSFDTGESEILVKPQFLKKITRYRINKINIANNDYRIILPKIPTMFESNEINRSWCELELTVKNTGSIVLEDWYLKLKLENPKKISDGFNVSIWLSNEIKKMMYDNRTLFDDKKTNSFHFEPATKEPLIQKSGRTFKILFIPHFEQTSMNISWVFFARDFDKSDNLTVNLEPEFKEELIYIPVESEQNVKEDKIVFKELIEEKK
ncbi:MAG: hypothetical protein RIB64_11095 [Arenibacter algicola]